MNVAAGNPEGARPSLVQRQHTAIGWAVIAPMTISAFFDVAMQSLIGALQNKS